MNTKHFFLLLSTATLVSSSLFPIAHHPAQAISSLQSLSPTGATQVENASSELSSPASPLLARSTPSIVRRGDSGEQAGLVSEIATTYSGIHSRHLRVITAIRTNNNRLKLISWEIGSESITRTGDSGNQAGQATQIDISGSGTSGPDGKLVTAVRTASGTLKLISWQRDQAGNITRLGDSGNQAGDISLVQIEEIRPDVYVTAVRTGNGRLKLITWRLNSDGSLTRLSDSGNSAGSVSEIALVVKREPVGVDGEENLVTTAVRDAQENLKLVTWKIAENGDITRLADSGNQAGKAQMIQIINAGPYMVTAVRTASGQLKLISWDRGLNRVDDSGNQSSGNNPTGEISLMEHPHNDSIVSAVRTNNGQLKLISWNIRPDGQLIRSGDSGNEAGTASLIAIEGSAVVNAPIVTAVRTQENRLKLIAWDD